MYTNRVLALIKFGKQKYIEEFVNNGIIYMNTLSYFKSIEHDEVRADKHEGALFCMPAEGATFLFGQQGKCVPIATITNSIVLSTNESANVFCMYAFRESAAKSLIDPRNYEFGDTYAILLDADEFLRRVTNIAIREKVQLKYGLVDYVNRKVYKGPMGVFRKFTEFSYQSEFRMSIVTGRNTPYVLRIGDISDISGIGPLNDLNNQIEIK
jgi:hypothetical protein